MLRRCLTLTLLLSPLALAGVLEEDGLEFSGQKNNGTYILAIERFKDATGAFAASLEPDQARYHRVGNYLIACERGKCPADLRTTAEKLPNFNDSALPPLRTYLPREGLIPKSRRYVLGPEGLSAAAPGLPVSAARFDLGTEASVGEYRSGNQTATLGLFQYATPSLARQEVEKFQELAGSKVKRSGPLVAVVTGASDQAWAEGLLGRIEYQASVDWDETPPRELKPSDLKIFLTMFELAGIVIGLCLAGGLVFGGLRLLSRGAGNKNAAEPMILLHLSEK